VKESRRSERIIRREETFDALSAQVAKLAHELEEVQWRSNRAAGRVAALESSSDDLYWSLILLGVVTGALLYVAIRQRLSDD
jgi:hypothetical protein